MLAFSPVFLLFLSNEDIFFRLFAVFAYMPNYSCAQAEVIVKVSKMVLIIRVTFRREIKDFVSHSPCRYIPMAF